MDERYGRRQIYEFCRTRRQMVRLDVVLSSVTMPDMSQADIVLSPTGCSHEQQCRSRGIRCLVYVHNGIDPCPDLWKTEI